jgi:hypothetical protein
LIILLEVPQDNLIRCLMVGWCHCNAGADSKESQAALVAQPESAPLARIEKALATAADSWQFDAFELAEAADGFPLSALGFYLMHQRGLIRRFKLDAGKLAR